MTKRRNEVGACGNYCAGCLDYQALANNDQDLRCQVAANITKELGREIRPEQVGCEGCWGGIHNDLVAWLGCKIRQCVEGKDFATCAECTSFPCPVYVESFAEDSEYAQNIRAIQEAGMEEWLRRK